jgi:tetratricopeptide (TPR) repeat protein
MRRIALPAFEAPTVKSRAGRARSRAGGVGFMWLMMLPLSASVISSAAEGASATEESVAGSSSPASPTADPAHATEPDPVSRPSAHPLPGQLSSKFAIDPRDPEANIPSIQDRNDNPLEFGYFLQDLLERADQARKQNDLPGVIRYYRAVAKAVPDRAKAWSKLCEAYEDAKDRDRAIRACRYAIDRPAVELQDYVRYVHLILANEGQLTASDRSELTAVLAHLEKQPSLDLVVNQLRCEMGVKLKDVPLLETCTKELARLAPDDPRTVVFEWSLAMRKGQRTEAERLIAQARKSGVVLENVNRMQELTSSLGSFPRRPLLLVMAAAALIALLAVGLVARRRASTQRLAR